MDDHMYDQMVSYAECDLIPRFQEEYAACRVMTKCESYEEMKAFCRALNAVAPYAGYTQKKPSDFLEVM